ncbi:MAG: Glycosyl transferase, family 2, partial [uncultured Frankineae bacterium]
APGHRRRRQLERRAPARRLPDGAGPPADGLRLRGVGRRQRQHRRLARAARARPPRRAGPAQRAQPRLRGRQRRRPARGDDAVRRAAQQRRGPRARLAGAPARSVRRARRRAPGRRDQQGGVRPALPAAAAAHRRRRRGRGRPPRARRPDHVGARRRGGRDRARAVGAPDLRPRGQRRGPRLVDPTVRRAARAGRRQRRAAPGAGALVGGARQGRAPVLGRRAGRAPHRSGPDRCALLGARRHARGRRRQQRRVDRADGGLRRRPRLPGGRRRSVRQRGRGVRPVRVRRGAADRGRPGRRLVRRGLLPLLRGHRPVVAAAGGRVGGALRADGRGAPRALGDHRRVVADLRLPHRPQPAAHAGQERHREAGGLRGRPLPAHHGLDGAARGPHGPARTHAATGAPDAAAPAGDGLVPAPAAGDAAPAGRPQERPAPRARAVAGAEPV